MFAELARTGDSRLRDELVEAHLGLAGHLARRFVYRGESYDDLVQVASIALIKAVDRFDPERGVEFTTFATQTILGELKRHFRDKGWAIRAPRRLQELYLNLNQSVASLSQTLKRSPTIAELAADTGATEEQVLEALEAGQSYRSTSLDNAGPDDEGLGSRLGVEAEGMGVAEWRTILEPHVQVPARTRADDPPAPVRRLPDPVGDRHADRAQPDARVASAGPQLEDPPGEDRRDRGGFLIGGGHRAP